jgi:protocatechuate 3,4-dioxygenase beta subunit
VDSINGLSPVSATVDFVVDTHVPVAPTITAPAPGQIVRTLTPSIHITSGGTTSAVSVSLTDSGGGTHTLVAGENLDGTWTAIPLSSLPNGATSVIATATDDLGGTSPASATINFIIDTNEPAAPVITAPTSGELLTTSTPSFDVTAGGTAFSVTVTVTDSSGIPLQITASSAGSGLWSAVPPSALADGVASVTAFATDTLGGTSPASTTVTFTIDTHEPAVPTITSPTSGQVVTTQTPTFAVASGGTTSAVTLTVTDSSGVPVQLSGATSTTPGVWTATPVSPLADGHATVSAVATDALGGSSEESTVVSFVVDTNVPVAPTITDPPAGKVVTSQTPTFEIWSGGSTASVAVTVTDSGGNTTSFSARNNGAGSWSATATTPLAVGLATVSAVATDDLGGSSPPSTSVGFTVDPNLPAVAITTPTSSEIVMTLTPTFVATVTSGTALSVTITVTDGSGNPTQLTANPNGDGTWSATPSSALVAGASSIFAVATDALTDSTTSATVDFSLNLCQGAGGCFSCPPTTTSQFLNQCTGAQCSGFDNATRIPSSDFLPDGGLIPL